MISFAIITYFTSGSLKPRKSHCNLQMSKGNCQAKLRRFYFDTKEGICKLFIFGGCQGKYFYFICNFYVNTIFYIRFVVTLIIANPIEVSCMP